MNAYPALIIDIGAGHLRRSERAAVRRSPFLPNRGGTGGG